jgi:anti-sigma regulatory factor (Ser/Thr protein kinase)
MTNDHRRTPPPARSPAGRPAEAARPPVALEQAFDGDSLYALRAAAAAHAASAGLPPDRVYDLVVAVHELAANAVRHGAGQGTLRIWSAGDAVYCEVSDGPAAGGGRAGAGTPPPADADPPPAAGWPVQHGHGLWLIQQVADEATVRTGPGGSTATVTFRRHHSSQAR